MNHLRAGWTNKVYFVNKRARGKTVGEKIDLAKTDAIRQFLCGF